VLLYLVTLECLLSKILILFKGLYGFIIVSALIPIYEPYKILGLFGEIIVELFAALYPLLFRRHTSTIDNAAYEALPIYSSRVIIVGHIHLSLLIKV